MRRPARELAEGMRAGPGPRSLPDRESELPWRERVDVASPARETTAARRASGLPSGRHRDDCSPGFPIIPRPQSGSEFDPRPLDPPAAANLHTASSAFRHDGSPMDDPTRAFLRCPILHRFGFRSLGMRGARSRGARERLF